MTSDGATATSRPSRPPQGAGGHVYGAVFGPGTAWFSMVALALSFVLPKAGMGVTLCVFKLWTSLPCPGCGLTRSITCISHLSIHEAIHHHPFGPVFYVIGLTSIAGRLAGAERRARIARWFDRHARPARVVYLAFMVSFIGYGLARLGLSLHDPTRYAHL